MSRGSHLNPGTSHAFFAHHTRSLYLFFYFRFYFSLVVALSRSIVRSSCRSSFTAVGPVAVQVPTPQHRLHRQHRPCPWSHITQLRLLCQHRPCPWSTNGFIATTAVTFLYYIRPQGQHRPCPWSTNDFTANTDLVLGHISHS